MLDLYDSDEVPGVALVVESAGETYETESDGEGYFRVDAEIDRALPDQTCWENAVVRAASAQTEKDSYELLVLAPGNSSRIGVISDIDDTVLETGATSLFSKGWNGLFMSPEDRVAVPGAPELYQMLAEEGGTLANPIFYVSSSSWNVYGYIARFMELKGIPRGPMFLKDFGLGEDQFFSGGHIEHKIEAINTILSRYPQFKFLLVGDNGQKDVETYHRVVQDHGDSVAGVFIRDVGGGCRDSAARHLLQEIKDKGIEVFCGERMDEAREVASRIGFGPQDARKA
ncbi:MAG TPA: phosphatase domain-containing protein [Allosphingosinicella sp.]|nr:phosphatase domain-containing protein [Allosphingosinicella sp.]